MIKDEDGPRNVSKEYLYLLDQDVGCPEFESRSGTTLGSNFSENKASINPPLGHAAFLSMDPPQGGSTLRKIL